MSTMPPLPGSALPLATRPVICVSHGFQSNYERGFCNGLAAHGVTLTLISSDRTDQAGLVRGVHTLNLRGSQEENRPRWRKALNLVHYHARLLAHTGRRRGAIVHVIGLLHPPFWSGIVLGLWFRLVAARYVLTVHDLLPHDQRATAYRRWVFGRSFRLAQRLVVHTERMGQELVQRFGVDPARVVVMAHGVEPLAEAGGVEPDRAPGAPPCLLAFGQIAPYKGTDLLLQALAAVDFPFRLVLAGPCRSPDFRALLQTLLAGHRHRDSIEWRDGFVAEEEMVRLFQGADLLLLPYRHIDQSGVLFQALRHGVPIVATRVGQFEHDVTAEVGELAQPDDMPSLAAALGRWHRRRASFSRQRIRQIGQRYEWPTTVQSLRAAYATG